MLSNLNNHNAHITHEIKKKYMKKIQLIKSRNFQKRIVMKYTMYYNKTI